MRESTVHPFVSVIIPTYNEEKHIGRLLDAVIGNRYPADRIEVLVIDGGSRDQTRAIVQEKAQGCSSVRLLENKKKIQAAAMNIGIREARGDYLLRLDGHTEVPDDFICQSVRALEEHPDAWVAGGYITSCGQGKVGQAIAAAMSVPVGVGNSAFRLGNYEGYVDTVAFGIHHKWVFDKIGGYDESAIRSEDYDFNLRVREAGGRIWLSKHVSSLYKTRDSFRQLAGQMFNYGCWSLKTMKKHGRVPTLRKIVPVCFLVTLIGCCILGIYHSWGWMLLAGVLLPYTFAILFGSYLVGRMSGWKCALLGILIFPLMHLSYGTGTLCGLRFFWPGYVRKSSDVSYRQQLDSLGSRHGIVGGPRVPTEELL